MLKSFFIAIALSMSSLSYSQTQSQSEVTIANQKAEYPGGQEVFRNEFMRMVYAYVDLTAYAVNGKFSFIITIDKNGMDEWFKEEHEKYEKSKEIKNHEEHEEHLEYFLF